MQMATRVDNIHDEKKKEKSRPVIIIRFEKRSPDARARRLTKDAAAAAAGINWSDGIIVDARVIGVDFLLGECAHTQSVSSSLATLTLASSVVAIYYQWARDYIYTG